MRVSILDCFISMSPFCHASGLVCLFFFQAEDGIRDIGVTGVQTCALPICRGRADRSSPRRDPAPGRCPAAEHRDDVIAFRSEERREGKSVDLGGRGTMKKKKETMTATRTATTRKSDGTSVPTWSHRGGVRC